VYFGDIEAMTGTRIGDSDVKETHLVPGAAVFACNEQDITRKGSKKGRHQLLMILPHQLAFRKGFDCELGELVNANTSAPSFVIKTAKGTLKYPGRFVSTSTSFFTVDLLPKAPQSVMSEMYQQLLVFDEPVLTESKNSVSLIQACDSSSPTADTADTPWTQLCGVSSAADPHVADTSSKSRGRGQMPSPTLSAASESKDDLEEGSQQSIDRPSRKAARKSKVYVELDDEFDDDDSDEEPIVLEPFRKSQKNNRSRGASKSAKTYDEDSGEEDDEDTESSISSEESDEYVESSSKRRKR